jgi:hypothetical protein
MTKFNSLSLQYQLDIVEDYLVMGMDDVAPGVHYSKLSDNQKAKVKVNLDIYLSEANISISPELVQLAEETYAKSPLPSLMHQFAATHSAFSETVSIVQPGQKVTIVKFDEFGLPYAINTVINSLVIKSYAQHKDSLFITHKPKGKRKLWQDVIHTFQEFIIYDEWLNVDIDSITKKVIRSSSSMTIVQGNYKCFDKRYVSDIAAAIPQEPLVTFNVKEAITC